MSSKQSSFSTRLERGSIVPKQCSNQLLRQSTRPSVRRRCNDLNHLTGLRGDQWSKRPCSEVCRSWLWTNTLQTEQTRLTHELANFFVLKYVISRLRVERV